LGEIKDYIWQLPSIGGIISIIAILCPAAYFEYGNPYIFDFIYVELWMWNLTYSSVRGWVFGLGFGYYSSSGIDIYLNFNYFSLIFGLVFSCIIIIVSSLTIFYANQVRKRKIKPSKAIKLWFLFAIIMITSVIGWMLAQEFFIQQTSIYKDMPFSFWTHFTPGFGVIGPIIAALLILINILLVKIL
jgi:hypothetical protein